MKTISVLLFLLCAYDATYSQSPLTITAEKGNGFVTLYAENKTICPLSVSFTFETENMHYSYTPNSFLIVPANTSRVQLMTLYRSSNAAYRYKYKYIWNYGDARAKNYDTSFVYELPYAIDSAYAVSQGYFGSFSHQTVRALDFLMPEGTPVYAARAGRVANVVQHNWQSCRQPECADFNNLIVIYHNDGTVAEYLHLMQNSATVKIGDFVEQGQLIAKSGNTGYSTVPHLHFWVYGLTMNGKESLPTKFQVGQKIVIPERGFKYFRRRRA